MCRCRAKMFAILVVNHLFVLRIRPRWIFDEHFVTHHRTNPSHLLDGVRLCPESKHRTGGWQLFELCFHCCLFLQTMLPTCFMFRFGKQGRSLLSFSITNAMVLCVFVCYNCVLLQREKSLYKNNWKMLELNISLIKTLHLTVITHCNIMQHFLTMKNHAGTFICNCNNNLQSIKFIKFAV